MLKARDISAIPAVIELLQGENVRKGFIGSGDFAALLENIPDTDVRDLVAFLYNAGWRSGEGKNLEWSELDLNSNMIRLPAEKTKSKKPRNLPDHRGATGHHPKAVGEAPARLPVCVSSQGQTDCLIPKGIQSSGKRSRDGGACCLTICDDQRLETSDAPG